VKELIPIARHHPFFHFVIVVLDQTTGLLPVATAGWRRLCVIGTFPL
jgi:hypothetical protein